MKTSFGYWRRSRLEGLEGRQLLSANALTYHNDLSSTGANLWETVLTPANVNATQFGKLATVPVDGQVYAQPLYMDAVPIKSATGSAVHNVVFVVTEHDSAYAVDSATGSVLWQTSFLDPSRGVSTVPAGDVSGGLIGSEIGITATPVIDPATGTMFVIAATKEVRADGNHYVWKLHALDVSTGQDEFTPLTIGDTLLDGSSFTFISGPSVAGTGDGSVNGVVTFNAVRQFERPALTLVGNDVFMAFGSYSDVTPVHGWLTAAYYTPHTSLSLVAAVNLSPNGSLADVWAAGDGVTYDGEGGFYVSTGNGTFDTTLNSNGFPAEGDYGDSIVKLAFDPNGTSKPNINGYGLKVVGYFTPSDQQSLNDLDLDLGSGGTVLLPPDAGSSTAPNLLVEGSKAGTLYLADRDNLPGFHQAGDSAVDEISDFTNAPPPSAVFFNTPAYFNHTLYVAGSGDILKAVPITNGSFGPIVSQSTDRFGSRGAVPTVSANGSANGIVWTIDPASNQLRAYAAANLIQELYTSDQAAASRDRLGQATKFSVPTVADGQVFVGTKNSLVIYGLLNTTQSVSNERFIAGIYHDVLSRAVDPAAMIFWTNLLNSGTSRSLMADTIVHSAEYYADVVAAGYRRFLGRSPDAAGLTWWVGQLQNGGLTDEQLETQLVCSPEFYAKVGGTDKLWIDAVYVDLLGRAADTPGESYWLGQLAFDMSRYTVANTFATSGESRQQLIVSHYHNYLNRSADQAGINYWLTQMAGGMTDEDLIMAFVASDEYYNRYANLE